jgi:sulfatase modifying factor 1
MANRWFGRFPWENLRPHGFERTSPVRRFPANGHGIYDVTGNVWEWTTTDWPDAGDEPVGAAHGCCVPHPPALSEHARRVTKGGSHLCAPSCCLRYRPAARQGQAVRSATGHLGFRCVRDIPAAPRRAWDSMKVGPTSGSDRAGWVDSRPPAGSSTSGEAHSFRQTLRSGRQHWRRS